jgi:hypothetical protein
VLGEGARSDRWKLVRDRQQHPCIAHSREERRVSECSLPHEVVRSCSARCTRRLLTARAQGPSSAWGIVIDVQGDGCAGSFALDFAHHYTAYSRLAMCNGECCSQWSGFRCRACLLVQPVESHRGSRLIEAVVMMADRQRIRGQRRRLTRFHRAAFQAIMGTMHSAGQDAGNKTQEQWASLAARGMEGVDLNIAHASPPLFTGPGGLGA